MAERKKKDDVAVEEVLPPQSGDTERQEQEDRVNLEEFNLHVKALVETFVLQHTQALEQRIADLEQLVGQPKEYVMPPVFGGGEGSSSGGALTINKMAITGVPDYSPEHQQGGVGWYQPDGG